MRQLLLAAGVVCAAGVAAHWASAQNGSMPGQIVGTGTASFQQVGSTFPQVGSKVGKPLNVPEETAFMRRADPSRPFDAFRGTGINPSSVVAPIPSLSNQNALERYYEKMKAAIGLKSTTPPPQPQNVTPGIFRRNRDAHKNACGGETEFRCRNASDR